MAHGVNQHETHNSQPVITKDPSKLSKDQRRSVYSFGIKCHKEVGFNQ